MLPPPILFDFFTTSSRRFVLALTTSVLRMHQLQEHHVFQGSIWLFRRGDSLLLHCFCRQKQKGQQRT
ncbi:hypothetical protein FF2_033862 [Malus domestica]